MTDRVEALHNRQMTACPDRRIHVEAGGWRCQGCGWSLHSQRTDVDLRALPDLFRAERERRGLSHRQAAEQIGYSYADLCRFEKGRKDPRLSVVVRMVEWLGPPDPCFCIYDSRTGERTDNPHCPREHTARDARRSSDDG